MKTKVLRHSKLNKKQSHAATVWLKQSNANHRPEADLQGLVDSRWEGQTGRQTSPWQVINHRENQPQEEPQNPRKDLEGLSEVFSLMISTSTKPSPEQPAGSRSRRSRSSSIFRKAKRSKRSRRNRKSRKTRGSWPADPAQLQRTRIWSPSSTA